MKFYSDMLSEIYLVFTTTLPPLLLLIIFTPFSPSIVAIDIFLTMTRDDGKSFPIQKSSNWMSSSFMYSLSIEIENLFENNKIYSSCLRASFQRQLSSFYKPPSHLTDAPLKDWEYRQRSYIETFLFNLRVLFLPFGTIEN